MERNAREMGPTGRGDARARATPPTIKKKKKKIRTLRGLHPSTLAKRDALRALINPTVSDTRFDTSYPEYTDFTVKAVYTRATILYLFIFNYLVF